MRNPTVLDYLYAPDALSWEAIFAEIDHMNDTPERVAARLGRDSNTISEAARRHGRLDLATRFKVQDPTR